jgi:hypothetical protein
MLLTPWILGADLDNGIEQVLSSLAILNALPDGAWQQKEVQVFHTGNGHYHIIAGIPTCIPLRVLLNDDPDRIRYSKLRCRRDGHHYDYLSEEKNGRKRVRCRLLEGLFYG